MNEYVIVITAAIFQIILSINLIIRQKNGIAIISEILVSLILFFVLNSFRIETNCTFFRNIVWVILQYFCVKIFLVIFMLIARYASFHTIKTVCQSKKKFKPSKLKYVRAFSRVKYWPKLKFGVPAMANKIHPKTKVRFDSKGFPKFKTHYTVTLEKKDYRKTREQHFYIANKMLYKKVLSSSRLRAKFSSKQIRELSHGETPSGYTWHHHQDAGVLQLVDENIHAKTSHIGGYSLWGGK